MKTSLYAWILSMGLVWSASAAAQTLADLYRQGVSQDPGVQAALAAEGQAQARMDLIQTQALPQVNVNWERRENRLTLPTGRADYFSANQTLDVRQALFRGDFSTRVEQARWSLREAQWASEQARRDYAARLAAAVFGHLLTREQLRFAQTAKQSASSQLHAAKLGFQAGTAVVTDIDDAQAQLDMARADLAQWQLQSEQAVQRLTRLARQPVSGLTLSQDTHWALFQQYASPEQMLTTAEPMQAQLSALRARLRSAELELQRIERSAWPSVDLLATWQRSDSENVFNPQGQYRNQQWGVQVNWPLYQGGRLKPELTEAQAKLEGLRQQMAGLREDLLQKIESQHQAVTQAPLRDQSLRQALRSAEQALISSRRAYQAGSRTLLDIVNAAQRVHKAQRDLMDARLRALMAYVQLEALTAPDMASALNGLDDWFVPSAMSHRPPARPAAEAN